MRDKRTPFERRCCELGVEDRILVTEYFIRLKKKLKDTPKREQRLLVRDFESACMYYWASSVSVSESLARLDQMNLGDFYGQEGTYWYPLDDAAKIYPLSMNSGWMAVFRLSGYLDENVVPEILQMALNFTIKRFPFFATTIKQGFFWHYIDSTRRRYPVQLEQTLPCAPLKVSTGSARSFRVLYYRNRVSVEFFHILTDGTGGMVFLKSLLAEYVKLRYGKSSEGYGILDINDVPKPEELSNDFEKAEKTDHRSGFVDKPAVQLSGKLSHYHPCRIIQIETDSSALHDVASGHGCTITTLMLAYMFAACNKASLPSRRNIQIQVPVNMRKFYTSSTLRNFALYCSVRIPQQKAGNPVELLGEISRQLKTSASRESMNEMMHSTTSMVNMLKYIPMIIKKPVAKLVYGMLGDKVFTNTLSNLGVVQLPENLQEHVKKLDFILGTSVTNRASCSMVSTNGRTVFSIAKLTEDETFEKSMVELMEADGLELLVSGSEVYGRR